jgi:DNA-binding CsgD family transcriptional regulator
MNERAVNKAKQITDSTSDPAFAYNKSGRIVAWNEAAGKLLGYPSAEVLGKNCWDVLNSTDIFGNTYCHANCPLLSPEGPIRHCDLNARTAMDISVRVRVNTLSIPRDAPSESFMIHLLESLEEMSSTRESTPGREPRKLNPDAAATHQRLTKRQRQVLRMLARGMKTNEISEVLGISTKTTRNHIEHINKRLGVYTRAGAVAFALRAGII